MNALTQVPTIHNIPIDMSRLIVTSHSIDNVFDYCARKFEFSSFYERLPLTERDTGFAAEVGNAFHAGIQVWLICRHEGLSEYESRLRGAMAFMRIFPWEIENEQSTSARSFEASCWAFWLAMEDDFWNHWELTRVNIDGKLQWSVEVPWILIHESFGPTNDGRYFATQGKIDLIMRHKTSGRVCSVDLKSTVYDRGLTRAMYTHSGQQIGYGQVVEAMLGQVIRQLDVIYFVIRISETQPSIEVAPFPKTPEQLADYWVDKYDRLERMKKYANARRFPRANGGCHAYSHECRFFDICLSRDQDLIEAWFMDSPSSVDRVHYDWKVRLRT